MINNANFGKKKKFDRKKFTSKAMLKCALKKYTDKQFIYIFLIFHKVQHEMNNKGGTLP